MGVGEGPSPYRTGHGNPALDVRGGVRAGLFGGSLLAEPSGSGGYVVRASLPVS